MTDRTPREARERSRGFALIVVLWFLVLIAAIGTYLMANARTETAIARNIGLSSDAEALADAGIAQAVFNLTDADAANRWKLDGAEHRLHLPAGALRIRLFDENAKVNPNRASDVILAALFESAGLESGRAARMGAALADWVSPTVTARPLGAKLEQYQQAGLRYGPPNAPAESLDELQLVLGMTAEAFGAVHPYLTLYTVKDVPDAQNASAVVQRALLLAANKKRAAKTANTSQPTERPVQTATDPDAPPPASDMASSPSPAPEQPRAQEADVTVVSIEIIAKPTHGGTFVRNAVLRIDPASPKGYVVLSWRRGEVTVTD